MTLKLSCAILQIQQQQFSFLIITNTFVVVNRKEVIILTRAEIKQLAKEDGLFLWQIAEKLGMSDSNFSRKLRKPLSETDTQKILQAIRMLKEEHENSLQEQA